MRQRATTPGLASAASGPLIAESAAMRDVLECASRIAPLPSTVLVTGETGTGKGVVAQLLHTLSLRSHEPFVKVSCAALPETLLESELFGHERGAFTGAERSRVGRFEQATRGTLFLDEIGETTPATQVKLLRVLEEGEFHRLGGTETMRTHARIVAATHRDLGLAVREGRFREDLYYRLDVIAISLPPLRERPEDIVPLAEAFLDELQRDRAREAGAGGPVVRRRFGEAARECLRQRPWRGNVRELRNAVERALLMSDGPFIEVGDLPPVAPGAAGRVSRIVLPEGGLSLSDVERELVILALERSDHVQKEAARLLGVSRRKLNYMIRRMGLTHPSWRRNREPKPEAPRAEPARSGPARGEPARGSGV